MNRIIKFLDDGTPRTKALAKRRPAAPPPAQPTLPAIPALDLRRLELDLRLAERERAFSVFFGEGEFAFDGLPEEYAAELRRLFNEPDASAKIIKACVGWGFSTERIAEAVWGYVNTQYRQAHPIDIPAGSTERQTYRIQCRWNTEAAKALPTEDQIISEIEATIPADYVVRYFGNELPADVAKGMPRLPRQMWDLSLWRVLRIANEFSLMLVRPIRGKTVVRIGDHPKYMSQKAWRSRVHRELGVVLGTMSEELWLKVLKRLGEYTVDCPIPGVEEESFARLVDYLANVGRRLARKQAAEHGEPFWEDGKVFIPAANVDAKMRKAMVVAGFRSVKIDYRTDSGRHHNVRYWTGDESKLSEHRGDRGELE